MKRITGLLVLWAASLGAAEEDGVFRLAETGATITVSRGAQPVLVYHKALVAPPAGQDAAFARSGFIHPLHAPSGAEVTGIHPDDHIHHLGLWHAWVETRQDGRPADFWNLAKKEGTVRYAETLETRETPEEAGFTVRQEQVALVPEGGEPRVVLQERFTVAARWREGAYEIDYEVTQKNVTAEDLQLPAYRYGGGVAYRAPAEWDRANSDYLTSEGKRRADSHATRARWCAMFGPAGAGEATVAMFCHPENRDAPQRIRTWDDGKIFFNYVPVQENAWSIPAGGAVQWRYRIIVHDGRPEPEDLEARWKAYAGKAE